MSVKGDGEHHVGHAGVHAGGTVGCVCVGFLQHLAQDHRIAEFAAAFHPFVVADPEDQREVLPTFALDIFKSAQPRISPCR